MDKSLPLPQEGGLIYELRYASRKGWLMSHFTVLVKVTADKLVEHNGNIEEAVEKMLSPYQENNNGDCPIEFMEFNDVTEEYKKEWAEKTIECVRLSNGELAFKWDSRFKKVKESGKDDVFAEKEFVLPEGAVIVEVPLNEYYDSFDEFVREWHGTRFNEEKQAYGHWENPNAKWDWYRIGGRWTGLLPVIRSSVTKRNGCTVIDAFEQRDRQGLLQEENYADIVIVGELDKQRMSMDSEESIHKFWDRHQRLKSIEDGIIEKDKEDSLLEYEINDTLHSLGLRKCIRPRSDGIEPLFENKPFTLEDLQTKYSWYWEFHTYAVVDDDGWHEKGQMGWFGISSETVGEAEDWDKSFVHKFLANEEDDTTLVVVDAHI